MVISRRSLIVTESARDAVGEANARRALVVVCLVGVALIHIIDFPGKVENAPLVGAMYVPLIIAALVLAEFLIRFDDTLVWAAAGLLAAATIIGYSLSRTVGLPTEDGHEIGKWTGDLGLASLVVEGVIVWLAVARWQHRQPA